MRVRRHLEDPVDQERAAPRNLLELPPVLHRAPTWKTRSTKKELHLEICSSCQKLVDTEGRVERFMKKYGKVTVEGRRKQQRTRR